MTGEAIPRSRGSPLVGWQGCVGEPGGSSGGRKCCGEPCCLDVGDAGTYIRSVGALARWGRISHAKSAARQALPVLDWFKSWRVLGGPSSAPIAFGEPVHLRRVTRSRHGWISNALLLLPPISTRVLALLPPSRQPGFEVSWDTHEGTGCLPALLPGTTTGKDQAFSHTCRCEQCRRSAPVAMLIPYPRV